MKIDELTSRFSPRGMPEESPVPRADRRLNAPHEGTTMNEAHAHIAQQLAGVARQFQEQRTGHPPTAVTAVLQGNTLVVTFDNALTPAERSLSKDPEGAARVQEFHRQLFANSTDGIRQEIERITGRQVRESAAEIETSTGAIVHAFTTGAMVQVFLLAPEAEPAAGTNHNSPENANDEKYTDKE